jgi:ABC-type Fe3+/spermidine/putrescine transport system ATPase subunit
MSLLTVRNLHKRYGAVVALRSANLVVEAGEIHALLGANGAGKSTLVKMLTGVVHPDGGEIEIRDKPVRFRTPAQAQRAGVAAVFQDPALVPDLTVRKNLRLTATGERAVRDWLSAMDLEGVDFDELVSDVPLPILRMLDLARALAREPERLVEVAWREGKATSFVVAIQVEALDRRKLLQDLATVLGDQHVNIISASSNVGGDRIATLRFTFELADIAHLSSILSAVRRVDSVFDAYRSVPG